MILHRLINSDLSLNAPRTTTEYTCVCGQRGTREIIFRHIAENMTSEEPSDVIRGGNDYSGNTKANYLPVEQRAPGPPLHGSAPPSYDEGPPLHGSAPPSYDEEPPLHGSAPPSYDEGPPTHPELPLFSCPSCQTGRLIADLPEIVAWSCGHWTRREPQSIAESFQDMLRTTFQAGAAAAASGETFETWYQREVLQ